MDKSDIEKRGEKVVYGLEQFQKIALGFLPGGHVIDGFLNYRSGLKQRRILNFTDSLKVVFEKELGKSLDNYDFETEDFVDLIDSIFRKVQSIKFESKLKGFQAILLNHVRAKSELSLVFVELITQLQEIEIEIFNDFIVEEGRRRKKILEVNELIKLIDPKTKVLSELEGRSFDDRSIDLSKKIEEARLQEEKALERVSEVIREYDAYLESINGDKYEISNGEYDFYINDLMAKGLLQREVIKLYNLSIGNKETFLTLTEFGKLFKNAIVV